MPLYEYRCQSCLSTFELLRPMADRQLAAVCPSCEGRTTMPLISQVALHAGAAASVPGPRPAPRPSGGGCGTSCGCH
ncbi:MAG TPA: zinc ribbon domain-containing protein [Candidatus Dormibacteraeota bacterium]